MGETILAWFQGVFGHPDQPKAPPKVDAYTVDYSALTNAEIAAVPPCDELIQSTEWIPVNRRA
jgi:hypothetical protein